MLNFILGFMLFFSLSAEAQIFDSTLLYNNKELVSRELKKKDLKLAQRWPEASRLTPEEAMTRSQVLIKQVMDDFMIREFYCDIGMGKLFLSRAQDHGLISDPSQFPNYLKYLRAHHLIDDLFYRLLRDSTGVIARLNERRPMRSVSYSTADLKDIDLKALYAPFNEWPNDVSKCSIASYANIVRKLKWKNNTDRDSKVEITNYAAFRQGLITQEVWAKLDILRGSNVMDWNMSTFDYLEVVKNAKDKLSKKKDAEGRSGFTDTYVNRKEKLTQRGNLYKNYNSTQIIMLTHVIERTARRMDARRVSLNFEFNDTLPDPTEIYVLSPMEQYRISIKMLKKEMADLMRSENFKGQAIEFEDLVAASFETGYITAKELDYIVKFEDFWNPKTPKWKSYANFAFSVAGTASFMLPPPWNIVGAIALVVSQSAVNGKPKPDPDDNWNVII